MLGYAHTLMQDTNNTDVVTNDAIYDDVRTNQISQVSRWQIEAIITKLGVLSNR